MLSPLSFWQHWPSLNATHVGQPNVAAAVDVKGSGEEDGGGDGEDNDDELENVFAGEIEPPCVDCTAVLSS